MRVSQHQHFFAIVAQEIPQSDRRPQQLAASIPQPDVFKGTRLVVLHDATHVRLPDDGRSN
jgi:hypothetical protein